jgi:hypothetical protein
VPILMLSSVLRSKRAIQVNIIIMRAFVKLRQILSMNKELAYKLTELEHKIEKHDKDIQAIFEAIRQLMAPSPIKPKLQIGFHSNHIAIYFLSGKAEKSFTIFPKAHLHCGTLARLRFKKSKIILKENHLLLCLI